MQVTLKILKTPEDSRWCWYFPQLIHKRSYQKQGNGCIAVKNSANNTEISVLWNFINIVRSHSRRLFCFLKILKHFFLFVWRGEGEAVPHTLTKLHTISKNLKLSSKFLGETSSSYTSKKVKLFITSQNTDFNGCK